MFTKANRTLGWIHETTFVFLPQDVKEVAFESLRGPILGYGSPVWGSHYNGINDELENVQKRASRFVTRNYSRETGTSLKN